MTEVQAPEQSGDDHKLMEGLAARDSAALSALYDRYSGLVMAVCLRVLRNRAAAEELLGDVFMELWQKFDRYDPTRASPRSYLVMLARSRSIDRLRKRRDLGQVSLDNSGQEVADGRFDPSQRVADGETRARVADALRELAEPQRQAIEIAFYEGLSHSEVADRLKRPLGTVKTQIRLGLLKLKDVLSRSLR